jgi:hypothetical protein
MSKDLEAVYQPLWDVIGELSFKHSPTEVAGVLVTQGLTLYKTFLSEEDYKSIVAAIANSQDQIKKLKLPESQ